MSETASPRTDAGADGAPLALAPFLSWDFRSRLLAIVLTVGLALLLDDWNLWVGFVISFGFAHYLLSIYYARRRIGELGRQRDLWVPLLGLGMFLALVLFMRFPLEIYFGIHHACNEAYLRRYHQRDSASPAGLAAARGLFHLAAYLSILRADPQVAVVPEPVLWTFLALSAGALVVQAVSVAGPRAALRDSSVEGLVLIAVAASFFVNITFLQLVMYHFVLWTIVPVPMIRRRGGGPLLEYGFLTAGSLMLFLVLTVLQGLGGRADLAFWYGQFFFWSYVHITTSFALSTAHPSWITQIFQPAGGAAGPQK